MEVYKAAVSDADPWTDGELYAAIELAAKATSAVSRPELEIHVRVFDD